MLRLRPGANQSSIAAFGKSAFAKTRFVLLKIRLEHINRAKSKNVFEHVLARFSRKHFARYTCQNVLESTFAFCSIGVRQSLSLTKGSTFEHVLAKTPLPKAALLDWSAPGLTEIRPLHDPLDSLIRCVRRCVCTIKRKSAIIFFFVQIPYFVLGGAHSRF